VGYPVPSLKVGLALALLDKQVGESKFGRYVHQFPVVAVILHDELRHTEFDQLLQTRFRELDRQTGKYLLFFSAMSERSPDSEPRSSWREFCWQGGVQSRWPPKRATRSPVEPYNAYDGICDALGLAPSDGPWVILRAKAHPELAHTDTESETLAIQVDIAGLFSTFSQLTDIASQWPWGPLGGRGKLSDALESRKLSYCVCPPLEEALLWGGLSTWPELEQPLLDALAKRSQTLRERLIRPDLYSPTVADLEGTTREHDVACRDWCESVVRETTVKNRKHLSRDGTRLFSGRDLESSSLQRLLKLVGGPTHDEVELVVALIVASVFWERLINESLVQLVRAKNNIAMPEYYLKPKPGVGPVRVAAQQAGLSWEIDINQQRNKQWQPISLGQSLLLTTCYWDVEAPVKTGSRSEWSEFLRNWRLLNIARNQCAHYVVHRQSQMDTKEILEIVLHIKRHRIDGALDGLARKLQQQFQGELL
jgi:hypothetical protein